MKNTNNSTVILTMNLLENATGIQPPPEWQKLLSRPQNAERIDQQINSPYYKRADYIRHNKKYKPVLRTCTRLSRIFFDELTDNMGQDNLLAISYNDIEKAFDISRPSIFPCIMELAEKGLIIYTPGTSNRNPSTFYINPKLAGSAKLSHQRTMEAAYEKTLKQQPALILNEKKTIPSGEKCLENFYRICKELGIGEETENENEFSTIPIANKKDRFYVNEIRATRDVAPNPKKRASADQNTDSAESHSDSEPQRHSNQERQKNQESHTGNMQKNSDLLTPEENKIFSNPL